MKNVQKVAEGLKRQIAQIKMVMAQKPVENATESKPKSRLVVEPMPMIRAASQPSFKGKIARGINYDAGNLSIFSKAKIKDLESKL